MLVVMQSNRRWCLAAIGFLLAVAICYAIATRPRRERAPVLVFVSAEGFHNGLLVISAVATNIGRKTLYL